MKPAVVVIAGPTGSGKTTISLSLASLYDGEIINADASQIRRGLDIAQRRPLGGKRLSIIFRYYRS